MISNVSLVTVWVTDIDEAKAFYTGKLGFLPKDDIQASPEFRWCTVYHPDHPELQLVLQLPGPPLDEETAGTIRRIIAKGAMHGVGLATADCRKTYEELTAKGVESLQEPADRPYGVEAVLRDNSGNWLVLIEAKPFDPGPSD